MVERYLLAISNSTEVTWLGATYLRAFSWKSSLAYVKPNIYFIIFFLLWIIHAYRWLCCPKDIYIVICACVCWNLICCCFYVFESDCLFACIFVNFFLVVVVFVSRFIFFAAWILYNILFELEELSLRSSLFDIDWSCQCVSNLYWFISVFRISVNILFATIFQSTFFKYWHIITPFNIIFFTIIILGEFLQCLLLCMVRLCMDYICRRCFSTENHFQIMYFLCRNNAVRLCWSILSEIYYFPV